jgi:predicted Rossmann fold nucleotide-binding protein DprA/Smf involved in DNA uptake
MTTAKPHRKVKVIEPQHPDYPAKLRGSPLSAPSPSLRMIGNVDLLDHRLLGFLCSRRCPGDLIIRTYDLIRALRDAGVPVIGGFHSPMEKECLDLLLRGRQPVVVCPARSIDGMRLPAAWTEPLAEDRLLILSPFAARQRRITAERAGIRNRLIGAIADAVLVPRAAPGSETEQLALTLLASGKRLFALAHEDHQPLLEAGAIAVDAESVVAATRH